MIDGALDLKTMLTNVPVFQTSLSNISVNYVLCIKHNRSVPSSGLWSECGDMVEDVVMDKSMQSNRSRNYLEEKAGQCGRGRKLCSEHF